MTKQIEIRTLMSKLEAVDMNSDKEFQSLVTEACELLNISDKELAREFTSSLSTVSRWKSGKNFPHPCMRKHVYNFFKSVCVR